VVLVLSDVDAMLLKQLLREHPLVKEVVDGEKELLVRFVDDSMTLFSKGA